MNDITLPPQAVEAEQSLIGAMLLSNDAVDTAFELVRSDDFYTDEHRFIVESIYSLQTESKAIDVITVAERMSENQQRWDRSSKTPYLGQLAKNTPSKVGAKRYAEIIKERSSRRRLITMADQVRELAYHDKELKVDMIIDLADRELSNILDGFSSLEAESIGQIMPEALEDLERRSNSDSKMVGLATGFDTLDQTLLGLECGELYIVAGRPGMGKTVFGMNIAENIGMAGHDTLVFSLEMPKQQLINRMWSSVGSVDFNRIRSGDLEESDWQRLTMATNKMVKSKIHIIDTPAMNPARMRAVAKKQRKKTGLSMIVVDYLQIMTGDEKTENRVNEVTKISGALKAMAKEFNVPVVALSQLNRSVEQKPNRRPQMSDLRETGAIEQDASAVIFLYRDEYYNKDKSPYKGIAEVEIAKQRNGECKTIPLAFVGKHQKFLNLDSAETSRFYALKNEPTSNKGKGGLK